MHVMPSETGVYGTRFATLNPGILSGFWHTRLAHARPGKQVAPY